MFKEAQRRLLKNPSDGRSRHTYEYFKEEGIVSGSNYAGNLDLKSMKKEDKQTFYKVRSRKFPHLYVGHYDSDKYKKKLVEYHEGKIKWKPNGRKWCAVPSILERDFVPLLRNRKKRLRFNW